MFVKNLEVAARVESVISPPLDGFERVVHPTVDAHIPEFSTVIK